VEFLKICVIAGDNPHYVQSLVQALANIGLRIDLIGDDRYEKFNFSTNVKFLNFRGTRNPSSSVIAKCLRILKYYLRCLTYIWKNDIRVVHVQAFRFNFLEGVVLLPLYRILGKPIVYTAHNLQPKGENGLFTYLLFFLIYRVTNQIICHTTKMKSTLVARYKIPGTKVAVIRHGLNVSVPSINIEPREARNRLGIDPTARVLLIFGKIQRYKGIDIALQGLKSLSQSGQQTVLLVAGGGSDNDEVYLKTLQDYVFKENLTSRVKFHTEHIPDEDIELFFQAADLLILPYREGEFQSGVLFLGYRFGLPVIVSDAGSFAEDVEAGVSGYIFRSEDPVDLAKRVQQFYEELHSHPDLRDRLQAYLLEKYQWDELSRLTVGVYQSAQVCSKRFV
jgi:glycosyltransferase involved in cell wall biosynthesis